MSEVERAAAVAGETWLALETATPTGSVAVWSDGLAFEQTQRIQAVHSERVLPAVAEALAAIAARPEDVTSLVVGSGPGSFTGVRIAASLAKGWVSARGTALYAYPSLLAVAAGAAVAAGPICALFDARRGEVYGACYELDVTGYTTHVEPGAWTIAAFLEEISGRDLRPWFAGEGAIVHRETIGRAFGSGRVLPEHIATPRAASLLWLRRVAPDAGRVSRPDGWSPLYVRDWRVPEEGAG